MADFGASYGEMEAMANKLSDARDDIQSQLDQLKNAVDSLLGNDFKTQHASGKFGQGYEELTTGLKNATDGNVQVALDAMESARHAHSFVGIDVDGVTSVVRTRGNADGHLVLRGGRAASNHRHADVERAAVLAREQGVAQRVDFAASGRTRSHRSMVPPM